jgi:hypothetical protein
MKKKKKKKKIKIITILLNPMIKAKGFIFTPQVNTRL